MKWILVLGLAAGCGSTSTSACEITIDTMSSEVAGTVTLDGSFPRSQPILVLTAGSSQAFSVRCVAADASTVATCDVTDDNVPQGTYTVGFEESCDNDIDDDGTAVSVSSSVPQTLVVN